MEREREKERVRLQNGPEINEKGSTSINAERGREKEWVTDYTTPSWDTLNTWERQRERVRSLFCSYKIWNEAQTWGWTEELLTQFDPSTETHSEALARKSKFFDFFCQNENFLRFITKKTGPGAWVVLVYWSILIYHVCLKVVLRSWHLK